MLRVAREYSGENPLMKSTAAVSSSPGGGLVQLAPGGIDVVIDPLLSARLPLTFFCSAGPHRVDLLKTVVSSSSQVAPLAMIILREKKS
jgi:hypothetical protein